MIDADTGEGGRLLLVTVRPRALVGDRRSMDDDVPDQDEAHPSPDVGALRRGVHTGRLVQDPVLLGRVAGDVPGPGRERSPGAGGVSEDLVPYRVAAVQ